jgi:UDP-N-acetylglucosamine--N-acetylmuramyl-(pentapeptide) pyrophosphoryl-undecaprenol N-acetylglucosamine transferase
MKLAIAAGGTGGHIFPALAVALELKEQSPESSVVWFGTSRSREKELCARYGIELKVLDVTGIGRLFSPATIKAMISFLISMNKVRRYFKKNRCDAVLAFGGYVSAPVLTAARLNFIPYFLHEQNSVMGRVNRTLSKNAEWVFLSFPLISHKSMLPNAMITGLPVKKIKSEYADFEYPAGFDRNAKGVLISGGSQGAASMNRGLVSAAGKIADAKIQLVWQTGAATFDEVRTQMSRYPNVFVFESIDDLYPYYARSRIVICRAGASTINEAAYFGLPCVMIPLPWAADNHQWGNAGVVESQGWGVRVAQKPGFGDAVVKAVMEICFEESKFEKMSGCAIDNAPAGAAGRITAKLLEEYGKNNAS